MALSQKVSQLHRCHPLHLQPQQQQQQQQQQQHRPSHSCVSHKPQFSHSRASFLHSRYPTAAALHLPDNASIVNSIADSLAQAVGL
jgi:hypothetical protein